MTLCRHFHGEPVERLIASVPTALVEQIDALLWENRQHPARRCRSEFIRLALAEKLARDRRKLMISRRICAREDVKVLARV
jgi:metal-responsive CopG/Arc/MetJ family transcriptional regulator